MDSHESPIENEMTLTELRLDSGHPGDLSHIVISVLDTQDVRVAANAGNEVRVHVDSGTDARVRVYQDRNGRHVGELHVSVGSISPAVTEFG